jgi:non-ribosomal peptide synthetase component F
MSGLTVSEDRAAEHNVSDGTDMTLFVLEQQHGIDIGWEYNTDLFETATIERVAAHFLTLLESLASNAEQRVDELPRLSAPVFGSAAAPPPALEESGYLAPRTATEQTLAALWRELLEVEQVGAHDNFFALGGASLPLLRLLHRIEEVFGVRPALRDLYVASSLADIAAQIDHLLGSWRLPPGAA